MKTSFLIRLSLIANLLVLQVVLSSGQEIKEGNMLLKGLTSPNFEDRDRIVSRALAERASTIKSLLQVAQLKEEKPQKRGAKELAIELLGEYRAEEAVDFLIKEISFRVPASVLEDNPIAAYPCARALVKMGMMGINGIFNQLSKTVTELDLKLFAFVIRSVEGDRLGLYHLENAFKETNGLRKENFGKLIEIYKTKRSDF